MVKSAFVKKVILSCQTTEQKESAYNWMNNLYHKGIIERKDFMDLLILIEQSNFLL